MKSFVIEFVGEEVDLASARKSILQAAAAIFDKPDEKIIDSMIETAQKKYSPDSTKDLVQMVINMMRGNHSEAFSLDKAVDLNEEDRLLHWLKREFGFDPDTEDGRVLNLDKTYEQLICPACDRVDVNCFRAIHPNPPGSIDPITATVTSKAGRVGAPSASSRSAASRRALLRS